MALRKSISLITTLFSLIAVQGYAFGNIVLSNTNSKHAERAIAKQETPDWYGLLRADYKPISVDILRQLENMRMRYRATHENMFLSVMSTSWACEKAQYSSLKQLKQHIGGNYQTEKDLWRQVLLGRFKTWEGTLSLHSQELNWSPEKLASFSKKIGTLTRSVDEIVDKFASFNDEVRYILCLEEEAGTFDDPTGILDKVNSVLGGRRPSKIDMDWYYSINKNYEK